MFMKTHSSCVRRADFSERFASYEAVGHNPEPAPGDICIVEMLDDNGYPAVENCYGREVRVYAGDRMTGVLGNRFSGTNNFGRVPSRALSAGDELSLLSVSGLLGECERSDQSQLGGNARRTRILGFLLGPRGMPLNIREVNPAPALELQRCVARPVFVFGTSAESGKTTLVTKLLQAMKRMEKPRSAGAFKAAGTGRLRDSFSHLDAGASVVHDFVDFGYPSTYGISDDALRDFLSRMLRVTAAKELDAALFEVGGDVLEGGASTILRVAGELEARCVLVLNDAVGAIGSLRIARDLGVQESNMALATMKQNPTAAAARIGSHVFAIGSSREMDDLARFVLSD